MPLVGIDLIDIASVTDGYVGADLAALCRESGMAAYREDPNAEFVGRTHFDTALKIVKPSVDTATFENFENIGKEIKKRRDGWDGIPFYG
jgi:transitional endoplasmic reticulum ATPase